MSRLRRLVREIHRRSLWQVVGIYAVGCWIAYQVVLDVSHKTSPVPSSKAKLLADKVQSISGFKPTKEDTAQFLTGLTHAESTSSGRLQTARKERRPARETKPDKVGFTLNGTFHGARTAKEVLVGVLEELSSRDPTFAERMAARPKHGRKRRYIARTPEELYPDREDLARDYSHQLSNGWWVGVNYGTRQIKNRILAMAAEVAGLEYGRDLIVHL